VVQDDTKLSSLEKTASSPLKLHLKNDDLEAGWNTFVIFFPDGTSCLLPLREDATVDNVVRSILPPLLSNHPHLKCPHSFVGYSLYEMHHVNGNIDVFWYIV